MTNMKSFFKPRSTSEVTYLLTFTVPQINSSPYTFVIWPPMAFKITSGAHTKITGAPYLELDTTDNLAKRSSLTLITSPTINNSTTPECTNNRLVPTSHHSWSRQVISCCMMSSGIFDTINVLIERKWSLCKRSPNQTRTDIRHSI